MLTTEERNELIFNHMSFAERIAANQFRKTPFCVQLDELKSAAYMGLVDAAYKHDGVKPFQVYASFRICGEIKDYLRGLCWGQRGNWVKASSWDDSCDYAAEVEGENDFDSLTSGLAPQARKVLYLYYAKDLTIKEVAKEIGLSATRIHQIIQESLERLRNRL